MSALGQKQTYAVQKGMSALPPKADMCGATAHVRFGPKADVASLIDDLVGAGEKRRWEGESERFCGLEVDRQLELGRLQEWQIGWLRALKNTTDIGARLVVLIGYTGAVADQATGLGEITPAIDCGYNCDVCS
jgi:hypothetical protein